MPTPSLMTSASQVRLDQDVSPVSSSSQLNSVSFPAPKRSLSTFQTTPLKTATSCGSLWNAPDLVSLQVPSQLSTPSPPSLKYPTYQTVRSRAFASPNLFDGATLSATVGYSKPTSDTNERPLRSPRKGRATVLTATELSTRFGSPDRFIPRPRSYTDLIKSFRTSKSLENLTITERALRSNDANENPFFPRRTSARERRIRNDVHRTSATSVRGDPSQRLPLRSRTASRSSGNTNNAAPTLSYLGPTSAIPDGRGRLRRSGTNAPLLYANFFPREPPECIKDRFDKRLAAALDINRPARVLRLTCPEMNRTIEDSRPRMTLAGRWWENCRWAQDDANSNLVLDAPQMRDDFYCSVLAFSESARKLAVGLGNRVYLWSEEDGVKQVQRPIDEHLRCYVGSLSFSSGGGGRNILAVGRSNGILSLWSLGEPKDKHVLGHQFGITCVSFKPVATFQRSRFSRDTILTEELLVGDEKGVVFYYSIQWEPVIAGDPPDGEVVLLARIEIHSQQICGMEWSPDGSLFATGGNDNLCLLFQVADLFENAVARKSKWPLNALHQQYRTHMRGSGTPPHSTWLLGNAIPNKDSGTSRTIMGVTFPGPSSRFSPQSQAVLLRGGGKLLRAGSESQKWVHAAAIKAIAFCPWQHGLLAVGGGSSDRGIHFYHVWSGACLATINVLAQVTSLIWSKTRREIVATLGYCQPDHPYRIAVYSWPSCEQILAIPWQSDTRALYAIPYPGGPNDSQSQRSGEGERWWKRTSEEGSIVVASSDESVKFHEVWSEKAGRARVGRGGFGWSDILEGLEGAEKDGGTIR